MGLSIFTKSCRVASPRGRAHLNRIVLEPLFITIEVVIDVAYRGFLINQAFSVRSGDDVCDPCFQLKQQQLIKERLEN